MEILNKIQQELKAPKDQHNAFGNYKYRSCEDILEAVKPLLGKATLILQDEIVQIGDRFYVKATATITDAELHISAVAFARECAEKKGMDAAQITGAASSYARKYALSGLFCIDDTKDADATDNAEKPIELITDKELNIIRDNLIALNQPEANLLKYLKLDKLENMPMADYNKAMVAIETKRKAIIKTAESK